MPKEKLILDIRYFESETPNINDSSLPDYIGKLFPFPATCTAVGIRIARKLREIGFHSGVFDHVYVNFTTCLPDGHIDYSPRAVHRENSWLRYVDFGLNPEKLTGLSDEEQENLVVDSTFKVLRFIASGDTQRISKLDQVDSLVKMFGSNMKILHKKKETSSYLVSIQYQVSGRSLRSTGWIEYLDKKSGKEISRAFIELLDYEDIFALVSEIRVSKGMVLLKPRESYKAQSVYNGRYAVPISIPITDLS